MYLVKKVEEKTSGKSQYGVWTLYVVTLENMEGKTLECSYFHSKKAPILSGGTVLEDCTLTQGKKADYPDAWTLEKPILGDPAAWEGGTPVPQAAAQPTVQKAMTAPAVKATIKFEDPGLLVPPSKANFIVAYVKDVYVAGIAAGQLNIQDGNLFTSMANDVKAFIIELNKTGEKAVPKPVVLAAPEVPVAPTTPAPPVTPATEEAPPVPTVDCPF